MKYFALVAFIGIAFMGNASNEIVSDASMSEDYRLHQTLDESSEVDFRKECTVRLDFKLDNGWTIEGELTFVDVTWWECTKMQVAAWWERNF